MTRSQPVRRLRNLIPQPRLHEPLEPRRLLAVTPPLLDPSFGVDGSVLLEPFGPPLLMHETSGQPLYPYLIGASLMAEAPDGKLYVAGTSIALASLQRDPDARFPSILRLNPDGTPDRSFGVNGALIDMPFRIVTFIELLPGGDLIVGGAYGDLFGYREDGEPGPGLPPDPQEPTLEPESWGVFRVNPSSGEATRVGPESSGPHAVPFDAHALKTGPFAGHVLILSGHERPEAPGEEETPDSRLAVWMLSPDGEPLEAPWVDVEALLGDDLLWEGILYSARLSYVVTTPSDPRPGFADVRLTVSETTGDVYVSLPIHFFARVADDYDYHPNGLPGLQIMRMTLQEGGDGAPRLSPVADFGGVRGVTGQLGVLLVDREIQDHEFDGEIGPGWPFSTTRRFFDADPTARLGVDAEGRLYLPGIVRYPAGEPTEMAVVRIDRRGRPDPSFDGDGLAHFLVPNPYADETWLHAVHFFAGNLWNDVHVRQDGSVVVITTAGSDPDGNETSILAPLIYRLLPDGSLDPSFAPPDAYGKTYGDGVALLTLPLPHGSRHEWSLGQSRYHGSMLTSDGNLLVGGRAAVDGETFTYHGVFFHYFGTDRYFLAKVNLHGVGGEGEVGTWDSNVTAQLVAREGLDVLEIRGSSGDNRIVLRASDPFNRLMRIDSGNEGELATIGEFALADIDRVEVFGEGGNDVLRNELHSDYPIGFVTLFGGAGNDTLYGNGRYDRLMGEDGDDSLRGGAGDQLLDGGAGNDTLVGMGVGEREALWGGPGNDLLTGSAGNDYLDGGAGDDTIVGNDGNDTLVAGSGQNSLDGGLGRDLLWLREDSAGSGGGGGDEPLDEDLDGDDGGGGDEPPPGWVANLATGRATRNSDGAGAALAGIENVLGGAGDDRITGDGQVNFLLGGAGNDLIRAGAGDDTLIGGAGQDTLEAGDGNDLLLDLDGVLGRPHESDGLFGGTGFDLGLIGSFEEDETDEVERVFDTLDDLLAAL